jgi:threonyl-tRNA synthetase
MESGIVSLRDRLQGDLGAMDLETVVEKLREEVASKTVRMRMGDSPE